MKIHQFLLLTIPYRFLICPLFLSHNSLNNIFFYVAFVHQAQWIAQVLGIPTIFKIKLIWFTSRLLNSNATRHWDCAIPNIQRIQKCVGEHPFLCLKEFYYMPLETSGDSCWFLAGTLSVNWTGEAHLKVQGCHNSPCDKEHPINRSLHNLSIHWLCTLHSVDSLYQDHEVDGWAHTMQPSHFLPLCLNGHAYVAMALWRSLSTVAALLFVLHWRNMIIWENPSIPP